MYRLKISGAQLKSVGVKMFSSYKTDTWLSNSLRM